MLTNLTRSVPFTSMLVKNACQQCVVAARHFPNSRKYKENKKQIWCCSIFGGILFLCIFQWIMMTDQGHGTFLPPFVWHTTKDFSATIPLPNGVSYAYDVSDFKLSFRVVVSMTTMPHHLEKLGETLDSLFKQTLLPDAIYLNIPKGIFNLKIKHVIILFSSKNFSRTRG